jgi:hypothetical protein
MDKNSKLVIGGGLVLALAGLAYYLMKDEVPKKKDSKR